MTGATGSFGILGEGITLTKEACEEICRNLKKRYQKEHIRLFGGVTVTCCRKDQ